MAQSLSNVLLHIVFSTKHRQPWIDIGIEEQLYKYLAGACRKLKCPSHSIGAADDHIHIACSLARTMSISDLIEEIKTGSSKWFKLQGDRYADFSWQNGYGTFSVGQSQLGNLRSYVVGQREHHRRVSYQDEFRALLTKYEVEFDERYVWD